MNQSCIVNMRAITRHFAHTSRNPQRPRILVSTFAANVQCWIVYTQPAGISALQLLFVLFLASTVTLLPQSPSVHCLCVYSVGIGISLLVTDYCRLSYTQLPVSVWFSDTVQPLCTLMAERSLSRTVGFMDLDSWCQLIVLGEVLALAWPHCWGQML